MKVVAQVSKNWFLEVNFSIFFFLPALNSTDSIVPEEYRHGSHLNLQQN